VTYLQPHTMLMTCYLRRTLQGQLNIAQQYGGKYSLKTVPGVIASSSQPTPPSAAANHIKQAGRICQLMKVYSCLVPYELSCAMPQTFTVQKVQADCLRGALCQAQCTASCSLHRHSVVLEHLLSHSEAWVAFTEQFVSMYTCISACCKRPTMLH
jgi:hypothetical protein